MTWKTKYCSHNATGFTGAPGRPSHNATGFPRAPDRLPQNLEKQMETKHRKKACSTTRGKIKVTCCSQGKVLTITSACDLGETCQLGLFLLNAVIAQGMALPRQAHACTKFHHCFQHNPRQLNSSAFVTPHQAIKSGVGTKHTTFGCKPFGSYSHLVTISKIGLLVRLLSLRHPMTCFRVALQWFWSEVLCLCSTRIHQP